MRQPGAETATSTAGEDAGAASTGGAGASSDMAAIGDENIRVREGGGGSEELGGGGSGGNRWPRQETLALLKIRSDMDAVFRDSSLKGPLWEEVSRKMAELGYQRSAKKCREKFENVYKYHKRTKDTRAAKGPDKTYRFFDQLEALESSTQPSSSFLPPAAAAGSPPVESAVPIAMAMPPPRPPPQPQASTTVTSVPFQLVMPAIRHAAPAPVLQPSGSPSSSSSSTSSDEGVARTRRKRKWKGLAERLTRSILEKQEKLQRKFLEAMERRENDRRVREEAWKAQEIARLKREHEILVQERSMAAARDAALTSFLQRLSDHQQIPLPPAILQYSHQSQPRPPRPPLTPTGPAPLPVTQTQTATNPIESPAYTLLGSYNAGHLHAAEGSSSASRWPKAEVEALINLRTGMEQKYQEGGPKGPLWEEISAAMRGLGYDRSSKRCKEKWENINKYFKKVKDNDKKRRRDDSKTCPYYHQLEAIYSARGHQTPAVAIVAQPEQQWPLPLPPQQDPGSANAGHEDEELYDDEEDDDQADG